MGGQAPSFTVLLPTYGNPMHCDDLGVCHLDPNIPTAMNMQWFNFVLGQNTAGFMKIVNDCANEIPYDDAMLTGTGSIALPLIRRRSAMQCATWQCKLSNIDMNMQIIEEV